MSNFYISDLHFFHKNVTNEGSNFDDRPFDTLEEMHKVLKENWNNVVTGADHVYILGDMCWKENEDAIKLVSTLKGNKHLILGNHDKAKEQRYRQLFVEILSYKEIQDTLNGNPINVVMSHYPIAFWNHQHMYTKNGNLHKTWAIHLYGHVHNSNEHCIYKKFIDELNRTHNTECIAENVGCMLPYMEYTPKTLGEILRGAK